MRAILILIWLMVIALSGFSQTPANINRIEYYFDSDPGYGSATPVSFSPAKVIDVSFNADISALGNGFHSISFRAKDANNLWSTVTNRCFLKEKLVTDKTITYLEYFIDTDPGYGSATPVSIPASTRFDKVFVVNIGGLPYGFHNFYARTKDINNFWSTVVCRSFLKEKYTPAKTITYAEYFFDTDPGFGKGINLNISPSDVIAKDFIADISSLADGFHSIFLRVKDINGSWSTVVIRNFLKEKFLPEKKMTYLEYFIDNDPGYGNGITVPITQGLTFDKSFNVDLTGLPNGFHTVFFRVKDINNDWGTVVSHAFLKQPDITIDMKKIDLIEYFIDTDPGYGKATPFPIPEGEQSNILVKDFIASLPDLGPSNHRFYMRCRNKLGEWSQTYDTLYCQGPSAKFTVDPVCEGQTSQLVFNTTNIPENTSFYWDINNDGSIESTHQGSISWDFPDAGTYYAKLTVKNNSICPNNYKDSAVVEIEVNPIPTANIIPTGIVQICQGDNATLTANVGTGFYYQWYRDNIYIGGAYTNTYIAYLPGSYKVIITSGANCSATSNITSIEYKPQPISIITPSGSTNLCPGTSVALNANTGEGLSYQWLFNGNNISDATGASLSVDYTGNFNVIVTNSSGCRATSSDIGVAVRTAPVVNLGKDTAITVKYFVVLNAGAGFAEYLWNDNSTNSTLTVLGSVVGQGVFDYSVTVTDGYGCKGTDAVTVTVGPPVPTISGIVQYEDNALRYLDSVKVYLSDTLKNNLDSLTTGSNGKYAFKNLKNGKYVLTAKAKKKWGGGNPVDALLINRYFIQSYSFTTLLRQLCADVNIDKKINPVDALLVNRRFVKAISSFKAGDWIFQTFEVIIADENDVFQNIKGICFGDVNGSF